MWNLILAILFFIPSIYSFIKMGAILKKDENIFSIFDKKEVDISEYSNSSPELKIKFLQFLIISMLFGVIAFYFIMNYFNK